MSAATDLKKHTVQVHKKEALPLSYTVLYEHHSEFHSSK